MRRVAANFFPPIVLDSSANIPLYRQVYNWFQRAILTGQLRPGQRVPSTRALAEELKISRIPVLSAFEQLQAEGYFETVLGSGTVVARSVPDDAAKPITGGTRATAQFRGPRRLSTAGEAAVSLPPQSWLRSLGAFRASLPALDHFPTAIWSKLVARHARRPPKDLLAYSDPMGYMPLREAIAEYLGAFRAVRCKAEQVMVVTGSQQALQVSARVLLNPGDRVWMEEPGYPGAQQALSAWGAQLVPVAVDGEGLVVEEGIRRSRRARAVYITPSHQYPLGMTMSAARRMQLLNWAMRNGSWIIEDDYDSEYRFGSRPIAALQGMDADERVIYVGTFSKVLFPALRVGYLVVPRDLARAFSAIRESTDIFSSTLYQAVLTDFIREGHFARHLRRMRMLYLERREALANAIAAEMGDTLEVIGEEAGMHLVALLPPRVSDVAVSLEAARNGISAMPLSICCLQSRSREGLILGYGGTDVRQIREGVRCLKVIVHSVMKQRQEQRKSA